MLSCATKLAFVDVETTGGSPADSRVTEVGIVLVQWPADYHGPPHVTRWHSLVNPGVPVPAEIQFLTGITTEMLADAPGFESLAGTIDSLLADAEFIAHHARFDYGFIKAEMARAGHKFAARTLCTVRLSRLLNPDRSPHTLDALIIRHRLPCPDRHRALGDAQVLWRFVQRMCMDHSLEVVDEAASRLLKRPNLPAHLGIESVEQIPARPGIYFFHGLNAHPLYIGKGRNIRQRIAAHFCSDHKTERGLRLASETRRISWHQTAGEFSALLAEIRAIHQQMPAHNKALRRNQQTVIVRFDTGNPRPQYTLLDSMAALAAAGPDSFGPFASRASARNHLKRLAAEHHWCQQRMGLERGTDGAPCFARQLGRCSGACAGEISDAGLHQRIIEDMRAHTIPAWPAIGHRLLVVEQGYGLTNWHLFDQWCWLAGGNDEQFGRPTEQAHPATFNRHVFALLRNHFSRLPEPPPHWHAEPDIESDSTQWHPADTRPVHRTHLLACRWLSSQVNEANDLSETDADKKTDDDARYPTMPPTATMRP